jgi:hypothetical protein
MLGIVGRGTTILLWAVVFLRMMHNIRAARAAHQRPTLRKRNTDARRRTTHTDQNGHPWTRGN